MNNNSAWTGKHLAYVPAEPTRSWKGVTRRLIACGTGAMMCASLLTPSAAFAAESVTVDGTEYTEVGSYGEGWEWKTQDDLYLNNYNGGAISAVGDLNVNYSGTNTVTSDTGSGIVANDSHDSEGKGLTDGNLTVSGSEGSSLTVTTSGKTSMAIGGESGVTVKGAGTVSLNSNSSDARGIQSYGDVTLDGANVEMNIGDGSDTGFAIGVFALGGVSIKNGTNLKANVTASADSSSDAVGIVSYGNGAADGLSAAGPNISIADSNVDVVTSAGHSFGLFAYPMRTGDGTITINNSTVHAVGSTAAILSVGHSSTDEAAKGTITINGASIVSPEGVGVVDYDHYSFYAQFVGPADAESPEDASKDVLIQADKKDDTPAEDPTDDEGESEATVTPASAKTAGSGASARLAQTGDASAAGMFAAAAAGVTALGAGAFLSRRRG